MKHDRCFLPRRLAPCILITAALVCVRNAPGQLTEPSDIAQRLLSSSVETVGPEYQDVETAVTLFKNGDFEGAKETLEKLKAKQPELPPAGVMLGQLFAAAKNPGAARNALEMAVRDEPNDPEAFVVFADTAFQQRRWTDADLLYQKASTLVNAYSANPKRKKNMSIRVVSGMAGVAEVREQWNASKNYLNEFIKLAPDNIAAQTRLGRVMFMMSFDEELSQEEAKEIRVAAYKAFQTAYNLDKLNVPRPEINMARLYQKKGSDQLAKQLFELALKRDAENIRTQLAAAQWALDAGDLALAKKCAEKSRSIDEGSFQVKLLDGILFAYEKDFVQAATAFEAAHQAQPTNPAAVNQLALALVEQPDETQKRRALEYVQMNSQRHNDLSQQVGRETAVTQAWVYFKLNQKPQAAQLLQRALQSGGVGADSAYFSAFILNELQRGADAARLLKPVLEEKRIFPRRKDAEALLQKLSGAGL